jgi:hypothetical protein
MYRYTPISRRNGRKLRMMLRNVVPGSASPVICTSCC